MVDFLSNQFLVNRNSTVNATKLVGEGLMRARVFSLPEKKILNLAHCEMCNTVVR